MHQVKSIALPPSSPAGIIHFIIGLCCIGPTCSSHFVTPSRPQMSEEERTYARPERCAMMDLASSFSWREDGGKEGGWTPQIDKFSPCLPPSLLMPPDGHRCLQCVSSQTENGAFYKNKRRCSLLRHTVRYNYGKRVHGVCHPPCI